MRLNKKIIFGIITGALFSSICLINTKESSAYEIPSGDLDGKSLEFGLSVDSKNWYSRWNNSHLINTYHNGHLIGVTGFYIGEIIYKKRVDGKYIINMVVACKSMPQIVTYQQQVLWWQNTICEYGYLDNLHLTAKITNDQAVLLDSGPKFTANDTSYSIGINAGVDSSGPSIGASASVSFTSNAINLTNSTNSMNRMVDISIGLNRSSWRWDYGRYKYMRQENWNYFIYKVKTNSNYLTQEVKLEATYSTLDKEADYWANLNNHYASSAFEVDFI